MAKTLKNMKQDFQSIQQLFKELPYHIANQYDNFVQDNFEREGFLDKTVENWPKRKRTKGQKRRGRRKLLVQSGALRRSISSQVKNTTGGKVIVVSSNVPYAKIHNEGGLAKFTAKVRAHKRRTKFGVVKVKAHRRSVNHRVPKRQFIGRSQTFEDEVRQFIDRQIRKIMR